MPSLSEAAAPKTAAAKRNQSSMETVSDVTVPTWKPASKTGKLGQKKG
jgi:hypothetical protein